MLNETLAAFYERDLRKLVGKLNLFEKEAAIPQLFVGSDLPTQMPAGQVKSQVSGK